MAQVGYSTLAILPGLKGFGSKLSSGIAPEMNRAGKDGGRHFGAGLASTAKGIGAHAGLLLGGAVAAGFGVAVAGIGAIIKTGFGEAMDASKGTAQLAAGIKSTGNAAHVSVKGMNALAGSIQSMSGQTDDSIVASENLLLTFTNIKNVGANKIFDQATLATANMAAKMGGDASGMAIKLGKALNDPTKGMTALSRVGVAFTKGQKDSVAAMMKHGDVAGAQAVILKELNTEFGGAAKAAGESLPGQLAKAKRSFEDVSQSVAEGLIPVVLPALLKLGTFITGTVVPGVQALTSAFVAGGDDVTSSGFAGIMERIGLAARKIADFVMTKVVPAIQSFIAGFRAGAGPGGQFANTIQKIAAFVTGSLIPAVMRVAKQVFPIFRDIIVSVASFVTGKLIPAITKVYSTVLPALMGLFKSVTSTMNDHKDVINFVKVAFGVLGDLVTSILLPALGNVAKFLYAVLGPAFRVIVTILGSVVIPAIKILVAAFLGFFGTILEGAAKTFGWIPGIGPKLQAASKEFNAFRDRTNAALAGIKPPAPITVKVGWQVGDGPLLPGKGSPTPPKDLFHVPAPSLPTPGSPAAKAALGGTHITVGTVVAHDYADFTKQLDIKARQTALRAT